MHPPRGSRQSKYRSAVAQKGPARHLTCRRAPGAGLSHSCQIGRRVKLYGLLPSVLLVASSHFSTSRSGACAKLDGHKGTPAVASIHPAALRPGTATASPRSGPTKAKTAYQPVDSSPARVQRIK